MKDWRKNVLFNRDSDKVMHLQDTGNRLINDKQTDNDFLINKQIMKNPISRLKGVLFSKVGYDPTTLHRSKVKE